MNNEIKKRIDAVLDRVKDPESGLSVSELGLVTKIEIFRETQPSLCFYRFFQTSSRLSYMFCYRISCIIINSKTAGIRVPKRISGFNNRIRLVIM